MPICWRGSQVGLELTWGNPFLLAIDRFRMDVWLWTIRGEGKSAEELLGKFSHSCENAIWIFTLYLLDVTPRTAGAMLQLPGGCTTTRIAEWWNAKSLSLWWQLNLWINPFEIWSTSRLLVIWENKFPCSLLLPVWVRNPLMYKKPPTVLVFLLLWNTLPYN